MTHSSRRSLLVGATSLAAVALAGCGSSVTWAQVKTYVADSIAVLDRVAAIAEAADPSGAAQIAKATAAADAAAAAFEALPGPQNGANTAQVVVTLISDALVAIQAVPGLPQKDVAIISSVQLLLVTVALFFNIAPPPASARGAVALAGAAKDKVAAARDADVRIRAWLSTH